MKNFLRRLKGGARPQPAAGRPDAGSPPRQRGPRETPLAVLPGERRVWAVAAVHGRGGRLATLHQRLRAAMAPSDMVVYLGGYYGPGGRIRETLDELLVFRRQLLARPDGREDDAVFLRGCQEEMLTKLLQIHYAPEPEAVLQWVLDHGLGPTLEAYGTSGDEALAAARDGAAALSRWTTSLRQAINQSDGHRPLLASLRHAAYPEKGGVVFVHAGVDPDRPLDHQGDTFWWGGLDFHDREEDLAALGRVVRGHDRRGGGRHYGAHAVTLDAGEDGPLTAACFKPDGTLVEVLEA
mgnify:CR=1 FL=1